MWGILYVVTLATCVTALPTLENVTSGNVYFTLQNIRLEGYHAEAHQIITEDEYILEVHRIPYRKNENRSDLNRPVVLTMHGLLGASNSYTIYGSEYSMGYVLADAGYDVWLGNARGTKNSRRHLKLDPDDPIDKLKFFDFTYEDIGKYDVAAIVNYILDYTKQERIHYIGHSQGATLFFVLNSMRPEFNRKFLSAHLMGPVGYQNHFPNMQLFKVARFSDMIYSVGVSLGHVEMYPPNSTIALDVNITTFCAGYQHLQSICESLGDKFQLASINDIDVDLIGGAAVKQLAHYGQNIRDRAFRRWNYGLAKNIQTYGSQNPPAYDLSKITVKTTLHYTSSDMLVDERDVIAMAHDMRNAEVRKVSRANFQHEEFVTAKDAKYLVTAYIIEAIATSQHAIQESTESYDSDGDEDYEEESPNCSPDYKFGFRLSSFLITVTSFIVSRL